MVRALAGVFAGLFGLCVLLAAAIGWFLWHIDQPGPLREDAIVLIPRGAGVAAIADQLQEVGVVDDRLGFRVAVRAHGLDRTLRAGEYLFPAGVSIADAMRIIASGRSIAYPITVAEGLTSAEVVTLLQEDARLTGDIAGTPPEGTLLPETYRVHRGDDRQALLDRMQQSMRETMDELWPGRAADLPYETREQALVLASIIEKETAVPEERGLVAGVFVNRLRRGMRLETDPTVIYALTEGRGPLGRRLLRADLDVDSPYNTYRVAGLPPGPIANPGRASIAAALNPAETDYLYFVADGSGGHAFARTLREHNRNVAAWRRSRRSQ